jgi:hypothetical protein
LGCQALIRFVVKRKKQVFAYTLAAVILITYFLFQTNFVYEVAGTQSWSVPLSGYRMDKVALTNYEGYIDHQDAFSAQWLSMNVDVEHTQIYSDFASKRIVLVSYGQIYSTRIIEWTNTTQFISNSMLYLSTLTLVHGQVAGAADQMWNFTDLSGQLSFMNRVYSNGGSEVYMSMLNTTKP